MGIIGVTFLSGLATISKATIIADEQATAVSLAESQMEWVKQVDYVYEAVEYVTVPIPDGEDYIGYSVTIVAESLHNPDDGIQKVIVAVQHADKEVLELISYKVDR